MRVCKRRVQKKAYFDKRSFRYGAKGTSRHGSSRVLVGCRKGKWNDRRGTCRVGTEAYEIMITTNKKRCPAGYRRK